jgi:hypothetical protein
MDKVYWMLTILDDLHGNPGRDRVLEREILYPHQRLRRTQQVMNPVLEPNEVERMVEDTLSDISDYLEDFSPEDQAQIIQELT